MVNCKNITFLKENKIKYFSNNRTIIYNRDGQLGQLFPLNTSLKNTQRKNNQTQLVQTPCLDVIYER